MRALTGAMTLLILGCGGTASLGSGEDGGKGGAAGSTQSVAGSHGGDGTPSAGNQNIGGSSAGAPSVGGAGGRQPHDVPKNSACAINDFEDSDGSNLHPELWPSEESCASTRSPLPGGDALEVAALAGTWIDTSMEPRLEIVLDATGSGTVLFGAAETLPPLTSTVEPYLMDIGPRNVSDFWREQMGFKFDIPRNGYRYAVRPLSGRGSEMTFLIQTSEPWAEWCAAQTPVRGGNCYLCEFVGDGGMLFVGPECGERQACYTVVSGELLPVHCGRQMLCSLVTGVCECNSEECYVSTSKLQQATVTLDPVDPNVLRYSQAGTRYLVRADAAR